MQIAVIGNAHPRDDKVLKIAHEVGSEIAKRKAVLVCGGTTGVMEAACRGAKEHGGMTVGILPGEDPNEANRFVDVKIVTAMKWARNQAVALSSDGVIMVGGEAGTLSEMLLAWMHKRHVVAIETSGGYAKEFAGRRVDGKRDDKVHSAKNAKEAVEMIFDLVEGGKK